MDIRTWRTRRNLTQAQLAGIIGVSMRTVQRWEQTPVATPHWVTAVLQLYQEKAQCPNPVT